MEFLVGWHFNREPEKGTMRISAHWRIKGNFRRLDIQHTTIKRYRYDERRVITLVKPTAANVIPGGLIVTVKPEKFTEFKIPPISIKIREESIKVSSHNTPLTLHNRAP